MVKNKDLAEIKKLNSELKKDYFISCGYFSGQCASVLAGVVVLDSVVNNFAKGNYLPSAIYGALVLGFSALYVSAKDSREKTQLRIRKNKFILENLLKDN